MEVSRFQTLVLLLIALDLPACYVHGREPRDDAKKITVTVVQSRPSPITQRYNGRITAHRHIEVRAPVDAYVTAISVKMGQTVKQGDVLLQVGPATDEEKPDAENRNNGFAIKAPFDGLVGGFPRQRGSFVLKGETLTTLSDNSLMWVYFNVPEAQYLEYMAKGSPIKEDPTIELVLANGNKFEHVGKIGAIEAKFNANTGTIGFRGDFPNPDGLLRHGQIGTVLMKRVLKDAIVIPQRATFEILHKRFVYVVDKDRVAHQREIDIQDAAEDLFVVKTGVEVGDKIVLEGVRLVRDGAKVE